MKADKKTSRRGRVRIMGTVLDDLLIHGRFAQTIKMARCRMVWKEVVGPEVSRQTWPLTFRQGKLLVGVASAVRMQELLFEKQNILKKMRQRLPRENIREIGLKALSIVADPSAN
jgi:predicted nucleic acid-binding Zn ribbon protein